MIRICNKHNETLPKSMTLLMVTLDLLSKSTFLIKGVEVTSHKFAPLDKLEIMLSSLVRLAITDTVGGCVVSWGKGGIGGEETEGEDALWAKRRHYKVGISLRKHNWMEKLSKFLELTIFLPVVKGIFEAAIWVGNNTTYPIKRMWVMLIICTVMHGIIQPKSGALWKLWRILYKIGKNVARHLEQSWHNLPNLR